MVGECSVPELQPQPLTLPLRETCVLEEGRSCESKAGSRRGQWACGALHTAQAGCLDWAQTVLLGHRMPGQPDAQLGYHGCPNHWPGVWSWHWATFFLGQV